MHLKHFLLRCISLPRALAFWTQYTRSPHTFLPEDLASNVKLSPFKLQLFLLNGWYHDFEVLGLKTGIPHPNQLNKQGHLFTLINRAIASCREKVEDVRGVELFCADGFYAN